MRGVYLVWTGCIIIIIIIRISCFVNIIYRLVPWVSWGFQQKYRKYYYVWSFFQ